MGKILPKFKQKLDQVVLIPSDGGRFEISVDGELIYSKLETGAFPDEQEIVDEIDARMQQRVS